MVALFDTAQKREGGCVGEQHAPGARSEPNYAPSTWRAGCCPQASQHRGQQRRAKAARLEATAPSQITATTGSGAQAGLVAGGCKQASLTVSVCGEGAGCRVGLASEACCFCSSPSCCHTLSGAAPPHCLGTLQRQSQAGIESQKSVLLAATIPTCCAWETGCAFGCVRGSAASPGRAPCSRGRQRR